MKVVLVSKDVFGGGAAIACNRLQLALTKAKIDTFIITQSKGNYDKLISLNNNKLDHFCNFIRFIWERLIFYFFEKSVNVRFAFSLANTGHKISKIAEIRDADIIHLHWFNQGFLSLNELDNILKLNKPIVWTLHDMWAFTGGCHHSRECLNYTTVCQNCKFLKKPGLNDLSNRIFRKKSKVFDSSNLTIVTCSNWLKEKAISSTLFKNKRVLSIPNPIDTNYFKPAGNKGELRKSLGFSTEKHYILFGAARVDNEQKGIQFLIPALINLSQSPFFENKFELLLFGNLKSELKIPNVIPYRYLGQIKDPLKLFQISDLFVLPSLEENLPNMIMESMACGTPVVAFNVGGIPEMIDHKHNGYLADYKSTESLAEGILWVLNNNSTVELKENARKKVLANYSQEMVSKKYIDLYNQLLSTC